MDEVSTLVQQALEAKGILPIIRVSIISCLAGCFYGRAGPIEQAQLLAAVYTTVDDKEREAGVVLERKRPVKELLSSPEGRLYWGW